MAEISQEQQVAFLRRMALLRNEGLSPEEARLQAQTEVDEGAEFGFRGEGAQEAQGQAREEISEFEALQDQRRAGGKAIPLENRTGLSTRTESARPGESSRVIGDTTRSSGPQPTENDLFLTSQGADQSLSNFLRTLRGQPWRYNGTTQGLTAEERILKPEDRAEIARLTQIADEARAQWQGFTPASTGEEGLSEIAITPGSDLDLAQTEQDRNVMLQEALAGIDQSVANGTLTAERGALFKMVTQNIWERGGSMDVGRIIEEFDRISNETISPEFAQLAKESSANLTARKSELEQSRALELETEGIAAAEAIEAGTENLVGRGKVFSSEAVKKLGPLAAYAKPSYSPEEIELLGFTPDPEASAIPMQQPDFAGEFAEGEILRNNRLIRTGTTQRHAANQRQLREAAEQELGTAGAQAAGFTDLVGDVTGRLGREEASRRGNVLSTLVGQEAQNVSAQQPLDFNFPTQQITT
jgi:hypothetical protein